MSLRRIGALLLVTVVVGTAVYGYRLAWGRPFNIDHFADRWVLLVTANLPDLLSVLRNLQESPQAFHLGRLAALRP